MMLTLSMEEINGQHCNSSALHRVAARGYIIIALYVVAQNMHGLFVALLYCGIAPLVHLRLLYALAYSCQRGLYFFFCSGYHVVVVLLPAESLHTPLAMLLKLLYTQQAFCSIECVAGKLALPCHIAW